MAYDLPNARSVCRRPAYTLLEVMVASAVGVLLMGALYMAISVQLRHAQIGREVVEQSLLARTLLRQIDRDIRSSLGPAAPSRSGSSSSSAGSLSAATAGAANASGTSGTTSTTAG